MRPVCGAAELLRPGGPVRVPLRECCVAALVGVDAVVNECAAVAGIPGVVDAVTDGAAKTAEIVGSAAVPRACSGTVERHREAADRPASTRVGT